MAILPDNEYIEFENRDYVNPQVSLDEQSAFIDNLRQTQQANNQQIKADTYNLGTAVPSNLGGLTGSESYWTSRYQTPQTNNNVANLRATAQANALNQVLQDVQSMWKKRYQDAYRAYQQRAYKNANSGSSGGGSGGNSSTWDGNTNKKPTDGDGEDGKDNGSGSNSGDGNNDNDNKTSTPSWIVVPPNPNDYYIDGKEQTENIQERTGLPDWMVNLLKIMG